jgi:hypothetical protein
MLRSKNLGSVLLLAVGIGIGLLASGWTEPAAVGQAPRPPEMQHGGPKYTVVETDIMSALVVDNSTNTVYFYTVEQGAEPGSDLHLRGSLDLTQVGQPVLKPKKAAGAGKDPVKDK